jgi:hypothetical protein
MTRKSSTETLIAAMRILARDIQSGDGVANAAISEAADRLAEQQAHIAELEQAAPEPDTVAVDDSQLLDDLELVAREYMTGFSVVYRHACEGEPGGFVAMRRRHRTEPAPTLREAVGRLLAGGE